MLVDHDGPGRPASSRARLRKPVGQAEDGALVEDVLRGQPVRIERSGPREPGRRRWTFQRWREQPQVDVLYWVGCAATYDPRARAIAEATVRILQARPASAPGSSAPRSTAAGIRPVGSERKDCSRSWFRRTSRCSNGAGSRRSSRTAPTVSTVFRNEYPEFGARIEVEHHSTLIHSLISLDAICARRPRPRGRCHAARLLLHRPASGTIVSEPRDVLNSIPGVRLTEMRAHAREGSLLRRREAGTTGTTCRDGKSRARRGSARRVDTGARVLVTECPFCLKMLEDAAGSPRRSRPGCRCATSPRSSRNRSETPRRAADMEPLNIVVCVKVSPDTAQLRADAETRAPRTDRGAPADRHVRRERPGRGGSAEGEARRQGSGRVAGGRSSAAGACSHASWPWVPTRSV